MDCTFIRTDNRITCTACGFSMAWTRDTLPRRNCGMAGPPHPPHGPGTELSALIAELGGQASQGCGCDSLARRMDAGGVTWCRENREEILVALRAAASKWGIGDWLAAAVKPVAWRLNPLDPCGSLLDLAIERASQPQRTPHAEQ